MIKEYNIVGSSFTGIMVFKYCLNGLLTSFELIDAEPLSDDRIKWLFSRHFPYKETQINNLRAYKNFTVTEGEFDLSFDVIYDLYKNKVKGVVAKKAWEKLSDIDKIAAIAGVKHYLGYCNRKRNYTQAHLGTYLNQRYWEDEWGSAA
jgi:hypothetical protein